MEELKITYYICIFIRKYFKVDKKLTLSLNDSIIEKAKIYAKQHKTSLSKMIEAYLHTLTSDERSEYEIQNTPLVESLCGVINLPENFDYKESKGKYLLKKYK